MRRSSVRLNAVIAKHFLECSLSSQTNALECLGTFRLPSSSGEG